MSETRPGEETPVEGTPREDENTKNTENTDLEELSDEGAGATVGEKDTFEPEESEGVDK